MKEIELTQGFKAIVDDDDYEWLSEKKWYSSNKGNGLFYAAFGGESINKWRQSATLMHRHILQKHFGWTYLDGFHVDHINGNTLDNRKSNIRRCTRSQNKYNVGKKKVNTSGFKGVFLNKKTNKWFVAIRVNGVTKRIGTFVCKIKAARAYDSAAILYHGEFASLNFGGELSH